MADASPLSIRDFVVTVDTRASGGDKVVLHLDRDGQPRLTIACSSAQMLWVIDDPELFPNAYKANLTRNIVECHANGWSFDLLARELGVSKSEAIQMHARAAAKAEEAAADQTKTTELAELGS
jgi:hypothetical protein